MIGFYPSIPILWYTSSYGKCMCFLVNFPQYGKIQQNPSNGKSLGNWFPYLFHSLSAFLVCSYPVVYFIICKIHGLSHQFPITWGKAAKLIEWEKPGKQVSRKLRENQSYRENLGNQYSCFPHGMSAFSHQIPILWYTWSYVKFMGFLINFQQHAERQQNSSNGKSLGNRFLGKSKKASRIGRIWETSSHAFPIA